MANTEYCYKCGMIPATDLKKHRSWVKCLNNTDHSFFTTNDRIKCNFCGRLLTKGYGTTCASSTYDDKRHSFSSLNTTPK